MFPTTAESKAPPCKCWDIPMSFQRAACIPSCFPNVSYTQDLGSERAEQRASTQKLYLRKCSVFTCKFWVNLHVQRHPVLLLECSAKHRERETSSCPANLLQSTSKRAFRWKGSGFYTKSQLDAKIPSSLVSALTYWKWIDVKVAYNARKETLQSGAWGKIIVLHHSVEEYYCFPLGFDSCFHFCSSSSFVTDPVFVTLNQELLFF